MLDKTICELFAGVGGFRLGFENASPEWKTVWANQWEPGRKNQYAYDCYCEHFGKSEVHVNKDIAQIDKEQIPDHSLLVGGFPCQDYSVARTGAKGIHGVKGVLWWEIRDILEKKSPKFVMLENVDRLIKSPSNQKGRDFGVMLACFADLNYTVEWRVVNASEYGFPQRRRRVFIFASKNVTTYAKKMKRYKLENIVKEYGLFAKAFPVETISCMSTVDLEFNHVADISDNFKFKFESSGIIRNRKVFTCKVIPKYEKPITLGEIIEENVDDKYFIKNNIDKWKYLKGAKKIERTSQSGHKYIFSEGPISFPDLLNTPARTMLTSESSLNRSTHVIEDPESKKFRLLTPIEAERIQGFKDNWTNTGMPEKFRYFCMGNALVVGAITRMASVMNSIFENENVSPV